MRLPAVLILGGTTEGYALARRLVDLGGRRVVSSLAGRTANPKMPAGEVRIGGFGGIPGLSAYVRDHGIDAVIDATHPFASRMGWNAAEACQDRPLLRLERPAWQPTDGDRWSAVSSWDQAAAAVGRTAKRVLMTIGRQELSGFAGLDDQWFLIRSVDRPDPMPPFAQAQVLLARGPFDLEDERRLLADNRIDTMVCKNSGGTATDAKLEAARELGVAVVILDRPARPPVPMAATVEQAIDWLDQCLGPASHGP